MTLRFDLCRCSVGTVRLERRGFTFDSATNGMLNCYEQMRYDRLMVARASRCESCYALVV